MADATPDRLDMVTLGMFMIDEFAWTDEGGIPTGKQIDPQERRLPTMARGGSAELDLV